MTIKFNRFITLNTLILCLFITKTAQADETWTLDSAHSYVGFKIRHMTVAWTRGHFNKVEGTISGDPKKVETAKIDITIDVASIDTDNEKRDKHLRAPDFFDVAQFPSMIFTSTKVKLGKDKNFQVVGNLTLKGVTKEVTLDVEGGMVPITDPWGNSKLGFSATCKINRSDFGIVYNGTLEQGGLVIGEEVYILIDVELNKVKVE